MLFNEYYSYIYIYILRVILWISANTPPEYPRHCLHVYPPPRLTVYGSANYFDCDDLDQSVKSQTSTFSYVKTCMKRLRSRYGKNGRYRVGIDGGPIPRVLGLSTATCDHGDNYLFTDIKVCCPG